MRTMPSKRVLMIAYYSYPNGRQASHRPCQLAKYLPRYGWTPTVLTVAWSPENCHWHYDATLAAEDDVCETVRVACDGHPTNSVRGRFGRFARLLFPFRAPFAVCRGFLSAAERLVSRDAFDVIWATYDPGMDLLVADRISRRHRIPWVADFRDIPGQFRTTCLTQAKIRGEVKVCASASALVAITQPLADRLAARHQAPAFVIPNGFDPQYYRPNSRARTDKLTIAYFGKVHKDPPVGQDPRPLFAALDKLAQSGDVDLDDFRLEFYGGSPSDVEHFLPGYECKRIVHWHAWTPYPEAIQRQQTATILLSLGCPDAKSVLPSKVPCYLGARRPILNVPGDGDVTDRILERTSAGHSAGSPAEIADILLGWYREWKASGTVAFQGVPDEISRYSREAQAGQLSEILSSVTAPVARKLLGVPAGGQQGPMAQAVGQSDSLTPTSEDR